MEANKITIPQFLKNWDNKEKGPVELQVFNLVKGVGNFGVSIWDIIKTIGLLLASIYCWIAKVRITTKIKPWIAFTIELVIFFILASIPILNSYVEKIQMRDSYSLHSYEKEKEYEQNLIKAEIDGYNRGLHDAKDSLIKEGWVKMKD